MPPWVMATALLVGLSGMACLIWGVLKNQKYAVWIGHFVVSSHMGMYFLGMGGWFIGLGTVSFATAGFVYPVKDSGVRKWLWLSLAFPPGLIYLFFMGLWIVVLLGGGM